MEEVTYAATDEDKMSNGFLDSGGLRTLLTRIKKFFLETLNDKVRAITDEEIHEILN